jgi:hypothetical protein
LANDLAYCWLSVSELSASRNLAAWIRRYFFGDMPVVSRKTLKKCLFEVKPTCPAMALTVASIAYAGGDKYGTIYKTGTSTWTTGDLRTGALRISGGTLVVNGNVTTDYVGLIMTGGMLSGDADFYKGDRRAANDFSSGTVDWGDLQILQDAFNASGAAGTPVPEPATLLIMLAGGLPALLKRRRSRG